MKSLLRITSLGNLEMCHVRLTSRSAAAAPCWRPAGCRSQIDATTDGRADRLAADRLRWTINHCCINNELRLLLMSLTTDYAGRLIIAASTTDVDDFSSAHQRTTLDSAWTLDLCCIDNGLRQLFVMCYEADRLARCEAKNGKVQKNRLHNASRASRPASPLSSPMDYAGRLI